MQPNWGGFDLKTTGQPATPWAGGGEAARKPHLLEKA